MTPEEIREAFRDFFKALHHEDERPPIDPFPWQEELALSVTINGRWPGERNSTGEDDRSDIGLLDLPTGSGKTAAIDIAVFALALEADRPEGQPRRAAMRTFFVIDRRVVVDEAARRARRIAGRLHRALRDASQPAILREMARRLVRLSGRSPDDPVRDAPMPLRVAALRGGMYRDESWADSPAQPLVCVSTVDQVGSRLLFRGYGLGRCGRVIHAGLVGSDSLILLDEAHLSGPLLETLEAIGRFRREGRPAWGERMPVLPFHVVQMSATPGRAQADFKLTERDRDDGTLRRRLRARKLANLDEVPTSKEDEERNRRALAERLMQRALELIRTKPGEDGTASIPAAPVVGVVVNRVDTARRVFEGLRTRDDVAVMLLTGRIRPLDRDRLLGECWDRIKAGRDRGQAHDGPLVVVATQTIEVGADLDFDALVTEAAPLDALRQRFGRLDRLGQLETSRAWIVARKDAVASHADDPIYGRATAATWAWLQERAGPVKRKDRHVDFGVDAMTAILPNDPEAMAELCSPRTRAPVLLPAHVDSWVQTDPIPKPDPEVSFFLHGPARTADVQIVWRADLSSDLSRGSAEEWAEVVALVPPSSLEALPVPIDAARSWLARTGSVDVADVEGRREGADGDGVPRGRLALRWRGPDESRLIRADDLRPGDTIVVPSGYGGADRYGWDPTADRCIEDLGDWASLRARGRAVLRVHRDVIASWQPERTGDQPALADQINGRFLGDSGDEDEIPLPEPEPILDLIRSWPGAPPWVLEVAQALSGSVKVRGYSAPTAANGLVLTTRRPIRTGSAGLVSRGEQADEDQVEADSDSPTDDDASSFREAPAVKLADHCEGVSVLVAAFARAIGLPDAVVRDMALSGRLHDVGKADRRFQTWLHGGDEIAAALADEPLAKSALGPQDRAAVRRARERAGYPQGRRHEALSVILAQAGPRAIADADERGLDLRGGFRKLLTESVAALEEAGDRDLVLHLIGSHHGWGLPFWPVVADEAMQTVTLQHGLERLDSGWTDRFWSLVRRYGPWGLALLEATLMLADHRRSRDEQEGRA